MSFYIYVLFAIDRHGCLLDHFVTLDIEEARTFEDYWKSAGHTVKFNRKSFDFIDIME